MIYSIFRSGVTSIKRIRVSHILIDTPLSIKERLILAIGPYALLSIEVHIYKARSICSSAYLFVQLAIDNEIPITKPSYYGMTASDEELAHVFKSDTKEQCPMLQERIRVMREAGKVLCEVSSRSLFFLIFG